jgi:hypothetical protein
MTSTLKWLYEPVDYDNTALMTASLEFGHHAVDAQASYWDNWRLLRATHKLQHELQNATHFTADLANRPTGWICLQSAVSAECDSYSSSPLSPHSQKIRGGGDSFRTRTWQPRDSLLTAPLKDSILRRTRNSLNLHRQGEKGWKISSEWDISSPMLHLMEGKQRCPNLNGILGMHARSNKLQDNIMKLRIHRRAHDKSTLHSYSWTASTKDALHDVFKSFRQPNGAHSYIFIEFVRHCK